MWVKTRVFIEQMWMLSFEFVSFGVCFKGCIFVKLRCIVVFANLTQRKNCKASVWRCCFRAVCTEDKSRVFTCLLLSMLCVLFWEKVPWWILNEPAPLSYKQKEVVRFNSVWGWSVKAANQCDPHACPNLSWSPRCLNPTEPRGSRFLSGRRTGSDWECKRKREWGLVGCMALQIFCQFPLRFTVMSFLR